MERKRMEKSYFAFFDSGVGGLTTLTTFCQCYPQENTLYYGDNAHAPYGGRPPEEIERLAAAALARLSRYPLRAAVIACNTVTSVCIEALRRRYSFPIVGVEPAILPAVRYAAGKRVLLLCTPAAAASRRVQALAAAGARWAEVEIYTPPRLAGEIEAHADDLSAVCLEEHLPPGRFDAAVLGCTHYVFLRERIKKLLDCPVFDGNLGTVDHLAQIANICSKNEKKTPVKQPIFLGCAKKRNKMVFQSLKQTQTNVHI